VVVDVLGESSLLMQTAPLGDDAIGSNRRCSKALDALAQVHNNRLCPARGHIAHHTPWGRGCIMVQQWSLWLNALVPNKRYAQLDASCSTALHAVRPMKLMVHNLHIGGIRMA
jgi:hypothetical protein